MNHPTGPWEDVPLHSGRYRMALDSMEGLWAVIAGERVCLDRNSKANSHSIRSVTFDIHMAGRVRGGANISPDQ
jgi:hypothetical protein